jgi:hypothetical protein
MSLLTVCATELLVKALGLLVDRCQDVHPVLVSSGLVWMAFIAAYIYFWLLIAASIFSQFMLILAFISS